MNIEEIQIRETPAGSDLPLHVQPRARRCEIAGIHNGALKLKVTAPPVDDAANKAIVEFFAAQLHISKSSLEIVSGLKSRDKTLRVKGLPSAELLKRLKSIP